MTLIDTMSVRVQTFFYLNVWQARPRQTKRGAAEVNLMASVLRRLVDQIDTEYAPNL